MLKHALAMNLPDNKLPGFYAQVIKALAGKIRLFDRDKEVLIVETLTEAETVADVLNHYHVEWDPLDLLLLPEAAELTPAFSDYGLISVMRRAYLYAELVSIFRLAAEPAEGAEPVQALMQMDEHLLARFEWNGEPHYAVDAQLSELIERIAAAYRCRADFITVPASL